MRVFRVSVPDHSVSPPGVESVDDRRTPTAQRRREDLPRALLLPAHDGTGIQLVDSSTGQFRNRIHVITVDDFYFGWDPPGQR